MILFPGLIYWSYVLVLVFGPVLLLLVLVFGPFLVLVLAIVFFLTLGPGS